MQSLTQEKLIKYSAYQEEILKKINEYKKIAIFAHRSPDFDAFGSSFGLASFLKNNYPDKEIVVLGENHYLYSGDFYPMNDVVSDEWFSKGVLAIVVDTATQDRASDERFNKADCLIKIDHHPNVDPYGDICFVDDSAVAVSEILSILFLLDGREISQNCATYLFSGIVGDSGRFRYSSTTATTFEVASLLISKGIDVNHVYNLMYAQELEDLECRAYILNNYIITAHGFAYYIFDKETQEKLNIPAERAKENVNVFSGIRGINVWAAITEDTKRGEWRVSLRSAALPINGFAEIWRGGGHVQASGASLLNKEEIPVFVAAMDKFIADNL